MITKARSFYFTVNNKGVPIGRGVQTSQELRSKSPDANSNILTLKVDQNDAFVSSANSYLDAKEAKSKVSDGGLGALLGLAGSVAAIGTGGAGLVLGVVGLVLFGSEVLDKSGKVIAAE